MREVLFGDRAKAGTSARRLTKAPFTSRRTGPNNAYLHSFKGGEKPGDTRRRSSARKAALSATLTTADLIRFPRPATSVEGIHRASRIPTQQLIASPPAAVFPRPPDLCACCQQTWQSRTPACSSVSKQSCILDGDARNSREHKLRSYDEGERYQVSPVVFLRGV